jgi:N utilization substance protein B
MSRRGERKAAAFLLYQRDLMDEPFEALYESYQRDTGEPISEFTRVRAEGVWASRERLDHAIDEAAQGWTSERMAVLERNILRLAVWEMSASPEAATLVNGILGRIARTEGVGT